jgi:N-acyl homoserine lactone hydrolase
MTHDQWIIAPLTLATGIVDKSQSLLYRDAGIKKEGAVLAWLLMNGERKILVDTGVFGPSDPPGNNGPFTQTPEQTMPAQLMRFDTSPDEIKLVINTHLHLDHCAGNFYFPGARFLVQKREMEYAKQPLYVHKPAYDVDLKGIDFQLLEGDADIAPGLKVILTPGHSPGSQIVLVETSAGLHVIAGDTVQHFENIEVADDEPFWPSGLYVDLREYCESLDRLKKLGGVILPGHDLLVLKKSTYP